MAESEFHEHIQNENSLGITEYIKCLQPKIFEVVIWNKAKEAHNDNWVSNAVLRTPFLELQIPITKTMEAAMAANIIAERRNHVRIRD